MQLLWRGFASHCRLETWILMSALTISVLLFAFGLIAQEVSEGELLTFDKSVMRALRNPANPSIPIGPPWLREAARNITSLGSTTVLGIISLAVVGYLFLARKPAEAWLILGAVLGGIALNNLLKFASPPHIICHHLPDDRSTSRANRTLHSQYAYTSCRSRHFSPCSSV